MQQAGEAGIGNVGVTIIPPAGVDLGSGAGVAITKITKSDGTWLAVVPGSASASDYVVSVDATTLPGGVVATPTNMGGGDTYIASVKDGDVRMSLDFGYKGGNPASIGDTVWIDTNGNGVRDAGEPGLSGIGLNLYTTGVDGIGGNADDQFVAFNTTDANGQYTFSVLLPGEYYVKLRPLNIAAGLVATADTGATGAGTNANNGYTGEITVVAGQIYPTADFGYQPASGTAVIGDRVWSDADGDGVQDAGEAGIGGATVQLKLGASVVATTVTAADGSYLFTNATAPNTYDVVVSTPPPGYTQTGDPDQPGVACTTCDNTDASVPVAAGSVSVSSDFGYQSAGNGNGSIGDLVYRSDLGNAGIADVTLSLYRKGTDGVIGTLDDQLVASTTTCGAALPCTGGQVTGNYSFAGLASDTYAVVVTDVNVKLAGLTRTATPAASVAIACAAGCTQVTNQDFGYASPTTTGSGVIGDTVYFDQDGNSAKGAGSLESRASSWSSSTAPGPRCWRPRPRMPTATTVSPAWPRQRTASVWAPRRAPPAACSTASRRHRSRPGRSSSPAPVSPATPTTTPTSASRRPPRERERWAARYGTISTATGRWNPAEPGMQGVTVKLWLDADGNGSLSGPDSAVSTTTANANGEYLFLGLPAGKYVVELTDTNGVTTGMTAVIGASPTADNNGHNNPFGVTLAPNTTDTTIDFAYKAGATPFAVSGAVFEDAGSSLGTFNPPAGGDDALVPGATVTLYRVTGGVQYLIGTTTTNGSGAYSFADLPAGTYVVNVDTTGTLADGYQQTVVPNPPGTGGACGDLQQPIHGDARSFRGQPQLRLLERRHRHHTCDARVLQGDVREEEGGGRFRVVDGHRDGQHGLRTVRRGGQEAGARQSRADSGQGHEHSAGALRVCGRGRRGRHLLDRGCQLDGRQTRSARSVQARQGVRACAESDADRLEGR